jgi:hypothetical protein
MTEFKRIEKHFKLDDDAFEHAFESCTLDPILFTHEAHLRLAFIHIQKYGRLRAIDNIRQQLKKYVVFAGESNKYHDTISVASINLMDELLSKDRSKDFKSFILEYPDLLYNFKKVINDRYSYDVFHSNEARDSYQAPDKIPFV